MKHESEYSNYLIPRVLRMASLAGFHVPPDAKILDFGCGDGRYVYDWRDAGYEAYGFDLHDTVSLRAEADRNMFRINALQASANKVDFHIDEAGFRIDFDDASFDLVLSNQVLEHTQDLDLVFRELSRIMKPQSVAFHVFPGSYRLIEPHVLVPLATQFQTKWWFRLWAQLGIRSEFQLGKSPGEVAELNWRYAHTGLAYRRPGKIARIARRYFNEVAFTPEYWNFPGRKARLLFASHFLRKLYTALNRVVLMTAKY